MFTGIDKYVQARKEGIRETHALQARGLDPALPVLSDIIPQLNQLSPVPLGVIQIALSQIDGTVTKGRTAAFSRSFKPLLESGSEFSDKWVHLYDAVVRDGMRDPVKAIEYYNRYYILEGNKRVSVMAQLDAVNIEADVTRVLPEPEDSPRYRIYQEFLRFYEDTKINYIYFSREGSFAKLYDLLEKTPGEKWSVDDLVDFRSCYDRFASAYESLNGQKILSVSDAFIIYLDVFSYHECIAKGPAEITSDLKRVWPEFVVAAANKPAALLTEPVEKQQGLLQTMLRKPQKIRCAFIYNKSPQESGWTYWHELGRKALEEHCGAKVETTYRKNVLRKDAPAVIDELVEEGYDVIFATSPVFLEACKRKSAAYPETKILNCSLLAGYHNVRAYYLRIYEAKFILGAIAGAMADDNQIGYIADYPIYGVPASINAFALGAQMTNPRAKVHLEWSTIPGHDPEQALLDRNVRVISNRDIRAPHLEHNAFGLYYEQNGQQHSLAMPVWNWGKLYIAIVNSILSGAWSDDAQQNADRAMNYYMGMSTDAIDLICSRKLPSRVRRLSDLLHARIHAGAFLPFLGPIYDQSGSLRVPFDVALTPQDVIGMDYLVENVIGRIPTFDELSDAAKSLAAMQGLKNVSAPATSSAAKAAAAAADHAQAEAQAEALQRADAEPEADSTNERSPS
ncbi:MAG: BMP family ABC transporter substrate-binding protein [Clostridia bacterium]|nr:BMP family ABC transporter substrate-binding protein [Clostridia bacterium]